MAAVYGGASIVHQIRQLRDGSQIVVATPGRLIDLMQRRAVDFSQVATCVLDEADEMLNMGFKEDIDRILERMPGRPSDLGYFQPPCHRKMTAIARSCCSTTRIGYHWAGAATTPNITHACYVMNERHRYQGLRTRHD